MTKPFKTYLEDEKRRKEEVIPATYDVVFKSILMNNKEYLSEIISGITNIPKEDILNKAQVKNSEHIMENIEEKKKTSDLIIEVQDNVINLEMDREYYKGLNKKNNEYVYKLSTINKGKNIIQINFVAFKEESKKIISKIMFKDEEGNVEDETIIKYKINLENLKEKYYNSNEELTRLYRMMLLLVVKNKEELKKISRGDKIMEEVNKNLNELSDDRYLIMLYDKEERDAYEKECIIKYQVETRVEKATEEATRKGIEKGIEKGIKEGIKKGIKKGYSNGILTEKENIAKNMLNMKMNIEDISKATGLSIEEIEKL